jgi:hypothetical protein
MKLAVRADALPSQRAELAAAPTLQATTAGRLPGC